MGLALQTHPRARRKARGHTWGGGGSWSHGTRDASWHNGKRKTYFKGKPFMSQANSFTGGCRPSSTAARSLFVQQRCIQSSGCQAPGSHRRTKQTRLLPSGSSHSNGEEIIVVLEKTL